MAVGPMSAGADPGPACYGKGGEAPTITDANLILGRIGTTLLGGKMRLNPEEAARAFESLRKRSGMGAEELASASLRIVNFQMAKAIEIVTLERGLDARDFALVAFGGAGPMHADQGDRPAPPRALQRPRNADDGYEVRQGQGDGRASRRGRGGQDRRDV